MTKKIIAILLCCILCMGTSLSVFAEEIIDDPKGTTTASNVVMRTLDDNGKPFAAPSGKHGKDVTIQLPFNCVSGPLYDVQISPVVSTDLDSFPFNITQMDYTQELGRAVMSGNNFYFVFQFTISYYATKGVKQVGFTMQYRAGSPDAELETQDFRVYLTVTSGYSSGGGSTPVETPEPTSIPYLKPKLIIDGYSVSAEKLYAGDTFTLTFTVRNTSSEQGITNLQLEIKDESGVILPANNGSGTMYIDNIPENGSKQLSIDLQSAPDAEAKPYTMAVSMGYDGVKSLESYQSTGDITFSLQQKIRTKCNDVVIYDDAWVGNACAMYIQFFNLGKGTIYNCQLTLDCEGAELEEPYFGGNLSSGASMNVDFSVIPSVSGEISGYVVISYEDVNGEQMETRAPLDLYVSEQVVPDYGEDIGGDIYVEPEEQQPTGILKYWWVGVIILGVAAAVTVIVIVSKKRRANKADDEI